MTPYRIATLEELWIGGRLSERRLSHGEALEDADVIVATDRRDDALVAACDSVLAEARKSVSHEFRFRIIAEARPEEVVATITVSDGVRSIVTAPQFLAEDLVLLRHACATGEETRTDRLLPYLWRNGSGAVLLHEAHGHAAEHEHAPAAWPPWLSIDNPLTLRRATFRDVPLLRMTRLVASQQDAPFELPQERIEVLLVDGGGYEPLTETVTLHIAAADLVETSGTSRLAPFTISVSRHEVARSLAGAMGDPIRYPGVICSREGQELVVGSWAPLLLMEAP